LTRLHCKCSVAAMTPKGKSTLKRFVAEQLTAQNTNLADLLNEVLEGDKSAPEIAYQIRRRTNVAVSGATILRWAKALRGDS